MAQLLLELRRASRTQKLALEYVVMACPETRLHPVSGNQPVLRQIGMPTIFADFGLAGRACGRQKAAMLLTPELCRAARALLNWKAQQLATVAGLDIAIVESFEADGIIPPSSVEAMLEALQDAGLEFIAAGGESLDGGPGLRTIPKPEPEVAAAEEAAELEEPLPPPAVI